jgi:hypothetical protein
MEKKLYTAPAVTKVVLETRHAILATCHSSPNITPKIGEQTCAMVPEGCYNPG